MAFQNDLDILLVGSSGSGLSSTCKSLTGEESIEVRGGWTPVTPSYQVGQCNVGGRTLRVADTPGVINESRSRAELMRYAALQAFRAFPNGFHAIILVISYSSRVTAEFADFLKDLKSMFGNGHWLETHGVVVVTGGDNFRRDFRDGTLIFQGWYSQQRGVIDQVFKESNFRCILFDNVTDDPELRERQRQELISTIDTMQTDQNRFVIRPPSSIFGHISSIFGRIKDRVIRHKLFCIGSGIATFLIYTGHLLAFVKEFWGFVTWVYSFGSKKEIQGT